MDLMVGLASGTADDLESLYEWLRSEEALRGRVSKLPKLVDDDAMGGIPDVLAVALSGGGTLTVLAGSISTWIRYHRSEIRIFVRKSGVNVIIEASNVRDPADAEALLRGAINEADRID